MTLRDETLRDTKERPRNKGVSDVSLTDLQEVNFFLWHRRCSPNFSFFLSFLLFFLFLFFFFYLFIDICPRTDFAQKAKSREGTLVTRAYIKESTYS